uniref:Ribosomal RNA-processing protein 43 n=1 Tax=Ascaris suum TaxID=6253 RepID=F1LA24_ASCSU
MSVDLLKICDPLAYYSQFLFESVYPDGRSIGSFRPISLQMGVTQSAAGSCVSRQGGAMVTARIEPFLAVRSDDSIIVPHIDAAPIIPQRVVEDAEVLLRQLIEEEAFFKRDQLVTANGRLMWILHLHIAILNLDGCLLDTLVTCVTGAFLDLQLPKVNVDLDEDITVNINEAVLSEQSEHISLADLPVLSTFIVLDAHIPNKAKVLCDPVADLFDLLTSSASIVIGNNARVYRMTIHGYCGDEGTLRTLFELAASRQKLVSESLVKARDAHHKTTSS